MELTEKAEVSVETKTTVRIALTKDDIVGLILKYVEGLPAMSLESTAMVYIEIPGGGDWSNTNFVIGEDGPLLVLIKG